MGCIPCTLLPPRTRRTTAPALLVERARQTPGRIAYRAKKLGLYRERTWEQYALLVARTAKAFAASGLKAGERIAIMADACEEWLVCDLAAQSLGAIVYGIYPTASAAEVEYQMQDGGAVLFIAEDQEYVDRILPLVDALPHLRGIVVVDDTALFAFSHAKLTPYAELEKAGDGATRLYLAARADLRPEQPAFIVYTSGTTGHPRRACRARQAPGGDALGSHAVFGPQQREHRTVAYLPLCQRVAATLPSPCCS
jgi:long-chain acyl-CoA synthetase